MKYPIDQNKISLSGFIYPFIVFSPVSVLMYLAETQNEEILFDQEVLVGAIFLGFFLGMFGMWTAKQRYKNTSIVTTQYTLEYIKGFVVKTHRTFFRHALKSVSLHDAEHITRTIDTNNETSERRFLPPLFSAWISKASQIFSRSSLIFRLNGKRTVALHYLQNPEQSCRLMQQWIDDFDTKILGDKVALNFSLPQHELSLMTRSFCIPLMIAFAFWGFFCFITLGIMSLGIGSPFGEYIILLFLVFLPAVLSFFTAFVWMKKRRKTHYHFSQNTLILDEKNNTKQVSYRDIAEVQLTRGFFWDRLFGTGRISIFGSHQPTPLLTVCHVKDACKMYSQIVRWISGGEENTGQSRHK